MSIESIDTLAQAVGARLQALGHTVTTAESCTGGLIAGALTSVPGSSAWFHGGLVTYDNALKIEWLGVAPDVLEQQGAVSEAVVAAMAQGALQRAKANWAIAVSGIAGPGGAVPGKPVGTVCLGLARRGQPAVVHTATQHFAGDRSAVREATVAAALRGLLQHLDAATDHA